MAESSEFMQWTRIEVARRTGEEAKIHARVRKALQNVTTEVRIDGKWVKVDPNTLTHEPGAVRISDI